MKRSLVITILTVVFLASVSPVLAGTVATVTVDTGSASRINTPVSVALDKEITAKLTGDWRLEDVTSGSGIPTAAQIEAGKPSKLCFILEGKTPANSIRTYKIISGKSPLRPQAVKLDKTDKHLEISIGNKKILRYNHAIVPPPAGQSPLYNRSAFIHPFWSPSQAVMTNIHPSDHYHHVGFWNPWTKTKFEGRDVDFWNLKSGQGTVRFVKFLNTESGPVFGRFQAAQDHVNLNAPGGEKIALNEVWDIKFWNTGGTDSSIWIWDYVSTQKCASQSPLLLEAYRYGGLGYRATSKWKEDNSDYLTSEGKNRKTGHSTRSKWCMMFGPTEMGDAGVMFMGHPENRDFPEPMRIWPSGDVFFNFCPIQKNAWTLEPDNEYVFKYRILVHNGKITPQQAERFWQDFGNPPVITIK